MSLLNTLTKIVSRPKKRPGRGMGSGKGGHTSGRGTKGQRSRTGGKVPIWFEGGQLPLIKRLPMLRGKSRFNVVRPTAQVTLSELNNLKANTISLDTLKLEKLISVRHKAAKVINSGSLKRKIVLDGLRVSQSARQVIEKLGGQIK